MRDDLEGEEELELELEDGATVAELLESEDIRSEEVLVSLDGKIISGGHRLEDGDTVTVRDVIAGG